MTTATETTAWRFALVGTPNSGKTALFNALTGSRQKVANYPGVTVERKAGVFQTASGHTVNLLDLPGTYSLRGRSPDTRSENEQAIVEWAVGLAGKSESELRRLQEWIDGGDVLAIIVSAAELNPRYRGRRLLRAKQLASQVVHWGLSLNASQVATDAPPMETEDPEDQTDAATGKAPAEQAAARSAS